MKTKTARNIFILLSIVLIAIVAWLINTNHGLTRQNNNYAQTIDSLDARVLGHVNANNRLLLYIDSVNAISTRQQKLADSLTHQISILQYKLEQAIMAADTITDSLQVSVFNQFTGQQCPPALLIAPPTGQHYVHSPIFRIRNANKIFFTQYFQQQQIDNYKKVVAAKDSTIYQNNKASLAKNTIINNQQLIIGLESQKFDQCEAQRISQQKKCRRKVFVSSAASAAVTAIVVVVVKAVARK